VILSKLTEAYYGQLDLFGEAIRMQRLSNLYESVDALREKYGKKGVCQSSGGVSFYGVRGGLRIFAREYYCPQCFSSHSQNP
jgi:hypothetical protein